jgi:hypothetical protein
MSHAFVRSVSVLSLSLSLVGTCVFAESANAIDRELAVQRALDRMESKIDATNDAKNETIQITGEISCIQSGSGTANSGAENIKACAQMILKDQNSGAIYNISNPELAQTLLNQGTRNVRIKGKVAQQTLVVERIRGI